MTQKGKENIAIASAGIFAYVGALHLLRIILKIDLVIGSVSMATWMSVLPVIGAFFLVYYNIKSIDGRNKVVWLKFIFTLVILDAMIVFYSWFENLNYWGLSKKGFGILLVIELIAIVALAMHIKKKSRFSRR